MLSSSREANARIQEVSSEITLASIEANQQITRQFEIAAVEAAATTRGVAAEKTRIMAEADLALKMTEGELEGGKTAIQRKVEYLTARKNQILAYRQEERNASTMTRAALLAAAEPMFAGLFCGKLGSFVADYVQDGLEEVAFVASFLPGGQGVATIAGVANGAITWYRKGWEQGAPEILLVVLAAGRGKVGKVVGAAKGEIGLALAGGKACCKSGLLGGPCFVAGTLVIDGEEAFPANEAFVSNGADSRFYWTVAFGAGALALAVLPRKRRRRGVSDGLAVEDDDNTPIDDDGFSVVDPLDSDDSLQPAFDFDDDLYASIASRRSDSWWRETRQGEEWCPRPIGSPAACALLDSPAKPVIVASRSKRTGPTGLSLARRRVEEKPAVTNPMRTETSKKSRAHAGRVRWTLAVLLAIFAGYMGFCAWNASATNLSSPVGRATEVPTLPSPFGRGAGGEGCFAAALPSPSGSVAGAEGRSACGSKKLHGTPIEQIPLGHRVLSKNPRRADEQIDAAADAEALGATAWFKAPADAVLPRGLEFKVADGRIVEVSGSAGDVRSQILGSRYVPGSLDATDVTRPLWRYVALQLTKPDGSAAKLEVARPLWWLESTGAKPGATIDLAMHEAGIEGNAEVLAIRPCDADSREGDPARGLVIATIEHQNAIVWDLVFDGDAAKSLGVTATHPIYSLDRDDFVPAGELELNERVLTVSGELTLTSKTERPTRQTVYNLEVHRDHAYHVSQDGILAHNTGLACGTNLCKALSRIWPKHHPFPKYLGGAVDQTLKKMPRKLHERFHAALDRWMNGKYARSKGADYFKNIDKKTVIKDLQKFYKSAEGGIFKDYLRDFLQAVAETGF